MMILSILRQIVPSGIVRVREVYLTLRRLGCPPQFSARKAISPRTFQAIKNTKVDLLPDGALENSTYIVDVGANEGVWSSYLLHLCTPEKLIAIEPSPKVISTLRQKLGDHPCSEIIEAAIGDGTSKTAKLNMTSHSHNTSLLEPKTEEMNSLYGSGYEVDEVVDVKLITLDEASVELPRIDILKIDTQGNELQLLKSAPNSLAKAKYIIIEANYVSHYQNSNSFWDLHDFMNQAGFVLMNISSPFVRENTALWADAIYRKR